MVSKDRNINIEDQDKFKSLFLQEKEKKEERIKEISKQIKSLDKSILIMQNDFNKLCEEKIKLLLEYENEK